MKAAAAVLAGALLFFLGVLSAASSDGGRVSAPETILLGVEPRPAPAASRTPAPRAAERLVSPADEPASAGDGETTDDVPAADEPAGDSTSPAPGAPESTEGDPSAPAAGEEPPTPGGADGVEEVGGRVECVDMGGGDPGAGDPGTGTQDTGEVDSSPASDPAGTGEPEAACPPEEAKPDDPPPPEADGARKQRAPRDRKGAGDGRR